MSRSEILSAFQWCFPFYDTRFSYKDKRENVKTFPVRDVCGDDSGLGGGRVTF